MLQKEMIHVLQGPPLAAVSIKRGMRPKGKEVGSTGNCCGTGSQL